MSLSEFIFMSARAASVTFIFLHYPLKLESFFEYFWSIALSIRFRGIEGLKSVLQRAHSRDCDVGNATFSVWSWDLAYWRKGSQRPWILYIRVLLGIGKQGNIFKKFPPTHFQRNVSNAPWKQFSETILLNVSSKRVKNITHRHF